MDVFSPKDVITYKYFLFARDAQDWHLFNIDEDQYDKLCLFVKIR